MQTKSLRQSYSHSSNLELEVSVHRLVTGPQFCGHSSDYLVFSKHYCRNVQLLPISISNIPDACLVLIEELEAINGTMAVVNVNRFDHLV